MSRPLEGKIAIVTGASRGIGREIALQFADRGVKGITITYHSNAEAAASTVAAIEARGAQALAVQTSAEPTVATSDALIQQTLSAFQTSKIDILVNNAGDMSLYAMGTITPEAFHKTYATNVLAPLLHIQAALPALCAGGSIVNISSRAARVPVGGGASLYSSSKAALEHLTRNLATSHAAERRITINNVMPGGTATDIVAGAPKEMIERVVADATAEKRLGKPEEVADVVCFIVGGGGSRWINGDTISVCGGAAMF